MVVGTSISSDSGGEYRGLFQDYVTRSTEVLSGQLHTIDGLLSQELQARVWLTLSYGLRLNWAWPSTRDLLMMVAPKMEQAGMWEDWLPCLARGVEKSQAIDDTEAEAELSLHLGHLLHRVGETEAARKWLSSAQYLFERLEQPDGQALALGRLANLIYRVEADCAGATELLDRAFELIPPNDPVGAFCHFVRGSIALDQGELVEAANAFLRAHELAEKANDRRRTALALLNLGRIYAQQELFEPAETHFERAIDAFSQIEDPVNSAVAHLNLGVLYSDVNRFAVAIQQYDKAETILRRCHGDRAYLAMVYNNKGMAYTELQEWAQAKEAYVASIVIWREIGNPLARLNVEDNLGEMYLRREKYDDAREILESALQELMNNPSLAGTAQAVQLHEELTRHLREANQFGARSPRATESVPA